MNKKTAIETNFDWNYLDDCRFVNLTKINTMGKHTSYQSFVISTNALLNIADEVKSHPPAQPI